MGWRERDWLPVVLASIVLVCGTVLAYIGNPRGDGLLGLGIGIVTGVVLRKRSTTGTTIPPGAGAVLVALVLSWSLVGCGSSPPPSVCAVARAAHAPCEYLQAVAESCDVDGGAR